MMINNNYSEQIAFAKQNGASFVNFEKNNYQVKAITGEKDTFTLSDAALAKMNGQAIEERPVTYIKPETASSLLAKAEKESPDQPNEKSQSSSGARFEKIMQSILDKRLGVDREKLEEIEAMMEEITKNENLSPEQKQKALEELEKMKEKVFEQSLEVKEQAKATFNQDNTKQPI